MHRALFCCRGGIVGNTVKRWCLIVDGRYPSTQNMPRDLALFEKVKCGELGGCLRIYNWDMPAVTIGHHQQGFAPVDATLDIPIIRRPTGGGAVLHGDDITFSISAPIMGVLRPGILESYTVIARALEQAFRSCALRVAMQGTQTQSGYAAVCFDRAAEVEIVLEGRKLMGAAQLRQGKFLLQQGVIPLTIDQELHARVFGPQDHVPAGVTALKQDFDVNQFVLELKSAFAQILCVTWD